VSSFNQTPSLGHIEQPRARTELGQDVKFLESQLAIKDSTSLTLKLELEQSQSALQETQHEAEHITRSLQD